MGKAKRKNRKARRRRLFARKAAVSAARLATDAARACLQAWKKTGALLPAYKAGWGVVDAKERDALVRWELYKVVMGTIVVITEAESKASRGKTPKSAPVPPPVVSPLSAKEKRDAEIVLAFWSLFAAFFGAAIATCWTPCRIAPIVLGGLGVCCYFVSYWFFEKTR